MKAKASTQTVIQRLVGDALRFEELRSLSDELKVLRESRPVITRTDGHVEGDILAFVRGLRLSVRVAYFLRAELSDTNYEVNWAHLLSGDRSYCSPECDIVIHTKGYLHKWNGHEHPIMDFKFIDAKAARAVISCKSVIKSVERRYPQQLKKFGVSKVFLFAECCEQKRYLALDKSARSAGYAGLYCLYTTTDGEAVIAHDDRHYQAFVAAVRKAVGIGGRK